MGLNENFKSIDSAKPSHKDKPVNKNLVFLKIINSSQPKDNLPVAGNDAVNNRLPDNKNDSNTQTKPQDIGDLKKNHNSDNAEHPPIKQVHNQAYNKAYNDLNSLLKNKINDNHIIDNNSTKAKYSKEVTKDLATINERTLKSDSVQTTVQMTKVYQSLEKLLNTPPHAPLTSENGIELAKSILNDLANPNDINQGHHKTCNVTTIREHFIKNNPDIIVDLAVKAFLSDGKVQIHGQQVHFSLNCFKTDLDSKNSNQDWNYYDKKAGYRDYFGQVCDNVLVNAAIQTRDPNLRYDDHEQKIIKKMNSTEDNGYITNFQYSDQILPQDVEKCISGTNKALKTMPSLCELAKLTNDLQGKPTYFLMAGNFRKEKNYDNLKTISDLKDLATALDKCKNPILFVNTQETCFDLNHQNGLKTTNAKNPWHVVTVLNAKDKNKIEISNQWGQKYDRTYTLEELGKAMGVT